MSRPAFGDRVGAILSSSEDPKEVQFLGYGTYVGERVPLEAVGWMAEVLREEAIENPCIVLDDGSVVYGCECWWTSETAMKKRLASHAADGYRIVACDIEATRTAWRAAEAEVEAEAAGRTADEDGSAGASEP